MQKIDEIERQNQARLDACKKHDWRAVPGRKPQTFICVRCGGEVDGARQNVYTPVVKVKFRG